MFIDFIFILLDFYIFIFLNNFYSIFYDFIYFILFYLFMVYVDYYDIYTLFFFSFSTSHQPCGVGHLSLQLNIKLKNSKIRYENIFLCFWFLIFLGHFLKLRVIIFCLVNFKINNNMVNCTIFVVNIKLTIMPHWRPFI